MCQQQLSSIVQKEFFKVRLYMEPIPQQRDTVPGEEPLETLPPVEGLDWNYAWLHLPDMSLLEFTVKEFHAQIDSAADSLEQTFVQLAEPDSQDRTDPLFAEAHAGSHTDAPLAQYRIQVHAMKSLAATVGILSLSGLAKMLEYAARDGKIDVITAITPAFLEEWRSYRQKLQGVFGIGTQVRKEVTDPSLIRALLEMVRISMEEMDVDQADQLMGQLLEYQYPEETEQNIRRLAEAVTNLDPQEADRLAGLLMDRMEAGG